MFDTKHMSEMFVQNEKRGAPSTRVPESNNAVNYVARAKLLQHERGVPIQLTLPANDAALLAFIAEEFAKSMSPSSTEGDRLQETASNISTVLLNCLSARDLA